MPRAERAIKQKDLGEVIDFIWHRIQEELERQPFGSSVVVVVPQSHKNM